MQLGLEEALPSLVKAKFATAKASQALIFSSTELSILRTKSGAPFQLRYCPALAKKPTDNNDKNKAKGPKPDPFDNPSSDLLIANIPTANPSHLLVLNKYPVIPQHFIIATKLNKQQTHMLEQDDLAATHACLKAWEQNKQNGKLFAFFNSGEHSGASQAHRHLQFLSVDEMKRDQQDPSSWDPLIERMLQAPAKEIKELRISPDLPFTHYTTQLPQDPSPDTLYSIYNRLYEAAAAAVRSYISSNQNSGLELHPSEGGSSPISYNLAMTTSAMAIVPRRNEGASIKNRQGVEVGSVALNGTLLAGTLMVKLEDEWNTLREDELQLDEILTAIGIPRHVSTLISSIHNDQLHPPSTMSSLRKRLAPPKMRERNQTSGCTPRNNITSDQYIVHLLREEEIIEAIQMVDPEGAAEMGQELEESLQKPWHYLDKSNTVSDEERLESFRKIRKEIAEARRHEDAGELSDKYVHEHEDLEESSPRPRLRKDSCNEDMTNNITTITPVKKKKKIRRTPSHNGEYTWSRKFYHIKQQYKYDEKDKQIAAGKNFTDLFRFGVFQTPEHQFHYYNRTRKQDSLRCLPDNLAYRPLDAARIFADKSDNYLWKMAAKRIRIIVTQH
ncbi:HIT-like protein, partial [Aureobasidium melanogenum]